MSGHVRVETSPDYGTSLDELTTFLRDVDPELVSSRVAEFIAFKRANGLVPFTLYGADKPSSPTRGGKPVPYFRDDLVHHCHLSLVGADPILVYRLLNPGHLVIMCVTTHAAMFRGDKGRFVQRYAAHFPIALGRRPRLRPRSPPET